MFHKLKARAVQGLLHPLLNFHAIHPPPKTPKNPRALVQRAFWSIRVLIRSLSAASGCSDSHQRLTGLSPAVTSPISASMAE
jgi:hypothetical protein